MGNKPSTHTGFLHRFRRQVTDDEISIKRNRRLVGKFLKRLGRQAKLDLSLDAFGYCYIPFKKFLIIIGVPDDDSGLLNFQTMVFDLHSSGGATKVHKRVAAANLTDVLLGKRGSTLRMEGDEISLVLSTPIRGLRFADMMDYLEDFMQTAVDTNLNLESIR